MNLLLCGEAAWIRTWVRRLGRRAGLTALLLGAGGAPVRSQPLVWDETFAPEIVHRAGDEPEVRITAMADGAFLVTGNATHVDGQRIPGLVRLGADGEVDQSFVFGGEPLRPRDLVAPLEAGRFLVVHRADPADGAGPAVVRCYQASGRLDTLLSDVAIPGLVTGAEPLPDGSVVVYGRFGSAGGYPRKGIARFTPAGALNTTYAPDLLGASPAVMDVAPAPGGAIAVRASADGSFWSVVLMRVDASGQVDPNFPVRRAPYGRMLLVQRDGRIIFGGVSPRRVGADGRDDEAFFPLPRPGETMTTYSLESGVELGNGELVFEIVAFGDWSITRSLVRYTSEGARLGTWPGSGTIVGTATAGHVLTRVAGSAEPADRIERWLGHPVRAPEFNVYADDGTSVLALRPDLGFPGAVSAVEIDPAGGVWVSGPFSWINGQARPGLAKLHGNGEVDTEFNPPADLGRLWPGVRLHDGHLWVYARETTDAWWRRLRRLAPDGSLAATGTVESDLGRARARLFGLDGEGRILAGVLTAAQGSPLRLARFDPNSGALLAMLAPQFGQSTFPSELHDPTVFTAARALADGAIVIAGPFATVDGSAAPRLARILPDGSVDRVYLDRIATLGIFRVEALLRDGGVLIQVYGPDYRPDRVVRLQTDGSVDPGFLLEVDGDAPDALPEGLVELPDGTLVSLHDPLRRWRADGSRVHTLNAASGATVRTVAQAEDGDWLVGGESGLRRLDALTAPGIVIPPVANSVAAGEPARFSVEVGDPGPATFQWQYDGVDIVGATRATLILAGTTARDAGRYRVIVRVGSATYISDDVALVVRPSTAHLVNFSARSHVPGDGPPQIAGFIVDSALPRRVLMRGVGLDISGATFLRTRLADPAVNLYRGNTLIASDAGSARSPEMLALAAEVGAFPPQNWEAIPGVFVNEDSALAVELSSGAFTLQTSSPTGASGISLAEFYDAGTGSGRGFVRNVSLRGRTGPGSATLIGGFYVRGEGGLRVLLRVVGSELEQFGVANVLPNPRLRLYQAATPVGLNDDWDERSADERAEVIAVSEAVGAFTLLPGSRSAAMVALVLPGAYTVHAETESGATGEVLLEVYVTEALD